MFKTLAEAFKTKEVRRKILFVLALILVYRIGCYLPIPGIDVAAMESGVSSNDFFSLMSTLSGGALSMGSFFALGVGPYITSSIVIQLLSFAIPSMANWSKEGESGKKKMNRATKITALVFAIAQAIGISVYFGAAGGIQSSVFASAPEWVTTSFIVLMLTAGAMITVWIGEKITSSGIGQGMSILIFVGIVSSACTTLLGQFESAFTGDTTAIWQLVLFAAILVLIFAAIVFVDLSERRISVQYAKQIKGRKMYGGQSTNIPIRLNANGVMPIIFANALLMFPQMLFMIFWPDSTNGFITWYNNYLGTGTAIYFVVMFTLIIFFAYFYTMMAFNADDISKQIQQNGGFIPGIRPGKPTSQYLNSINKRITLFGALFLGAVAILPTILFSAIGTSGLVSAFSATGLLIVVSVALELEKSLDAQLMMRNYRGFLK